MNKILSYIDLSVLKKYIDDGLIITQIHPTYPLTILNYSRKVQFEGLWDDYTTSCRGLIIETNTGKIIGRPYQKFLNIEQHKPEEIPNLPFEVFNKEDGSLLIMFYYENLWHCATRGSFTSDQAIKGKEILSKHDLSLFDKSYTMLGEVIYPSNRIVVSYGDLEDIILHGAIDTITGNEMSWDNINDLYSTNFTIVKKYNGIKDLSILREVQESNREGYVIRFSNGFRCKAKFQEYCMLHSIVTNISNIVVWEYLKDGKSFDELLERTPDEWDAFVKTTEKELRDKFTVIEETHIVELKKIRKAVAELVFALKGVNSKLLFEMVGGKDYSKTIWSMIRPKWCKPFMNADEDL